MKKTRITLVLLILLNAVVPGICSADETAESKNDCARAPAENPAPCVDAACAARAKAEMDRMLACHKAKMAEFAAQAGMPVKDGLGGSK
jgi:hypothetical protein